MHNLGGNLKHNLSEYNRRMEWNWLRFSLTDHGVVPSHSWLFALLLCQTILNWCPRYFHKIVPWFFSNGRVASLSVDVTSCQKLRQHMLMTLVSLYITAIHTLLYLARIQSCTISLFGHNFPLPHNFLEVASGCHVLFLFLFFSNIFFGAVQYFGVESFYFSFFSQKFPKDGSCTLSVLSI